MAICGWKTRSTFGCYRIGNEALADGLGKLTAANAQPAKRAEATDTVTAFRKVAG